MAKCKLITLPRDVSDHCPLLLKSHSDNFGPIPFKFFNSWLLNDEFPTVFSQSWSSSLMSSATTHPAIILKEKLQHLKKHIRMWRSNATSNSDNLIQDLKDKVEVLDAKAKNGCLVNHEIETRISLLKQLEDHNHIKRLDLMQKAKIKWAIDGDENSKFFHGFINSKISRSRINRILFNGFWVTDPPLVMSHIFNFHKNKFANNIPNRPRFTSNKFKTLSTDDLSLLDARFTSKEIKDAVWDCGGGKAPCNTPKLGRSGIWVRGVLLHESTTQDIYRTTKKSFENDTLDLTK
ncbi:hypothetical protein Tco_1134412 [Tanacetum coccineum]